MARTEPFFYDSAYKLVKKVYAMPIVSYEPPMKWECSSECKMLSDSAVGTIIDLDIIFAGGAWIKRK